MAEAVAVPEVAAGVVPQAVVLRLYPSEEQAGRMRAWIGVGRALWNHLLALQKATYEAEHRFLGHKELEQARQAWESEPDCAWRGGPQSQTRQQVVRDLETAFRNFFKSRRGERKGPKLGFPRFKKKRMGGTIYLANARFTFDLDRRRVRIGKLGEIGFRSGDRVPTGHILGARVRLEAGRWYLAVQMEAPPPRVFKAPTRDIIGVDVGVTTLASRSDGVEHKAPRPLRKMERRLRRLSRRMNDREPKKGERPSGRFRDAAQRVARLHARIRNIRRDAQHHASSRIVAKAAMVGIETLSLKGMARSRLAKSVADAGMGELHRQIGYKAAWNGRDVEPLDPFERSTGCCPDCGTIGPRLPVSVRRWRCAGCGRRHERDPAAASYIEAVVRSRQVGAVSAEPGERPLRAGMRGDQALPACPAASVPLDEPRSPVREHRASGVSPGIPTRARNTSRRAEVGRAGPSP